MNPLSPSLEPALQQEIESVVASLDTAWRSGDAAQWQAGVRECDRMLAALGDGVAVNPAEVPKVEASPVEGDAAVATVDPRTTARSTLWLKRGHLLEAMGTGEAAGQALECYGRAIAALEGLPGPRPAVGRAVAWMNRGNVLQGYRDERAWAEAVRCYDQAIGWLGSLSANGQVDAEMANMLAAAWTNRGSALRQFGKKEQWEDAAKSFEQSLGLFQQLAAVNPALVPNVISAWGNRGDAKFALGEMGEAARSHAEAKATLKKWSVQNGQKLEPWDFAGPAFQLGQALGQAGDADGALVEMREVLALVAPDENEEVPAAILGLRARHAVCVILGARMSVGGEAAAGLRAEASDLAEEGLVLAAVWKGRQEEEMIGGPALGLRLYEFGAWLYRTQQPHFLAEFLSDHLGDPDGPRASLAAKVLAQTRQEILQRPLPNLSPAEITRTQALLEGLRTLESRLGLGTVARVAG